MHPYAHATSSAAIHGGSAVDFFPFHAWFDVSKMELSFFTHRALRHHLEGVMVAATRFGSEYVTPSGLAVSTTELGMQHLDEDCTIRPTASDWLRELKRPEWLPDWCDDTQAMAEREAVGLQVEPGDLMPVYQWFVETSTWHDDSRHLAMRHHAFGIFEAEQVFGPVIQAANGLVLPTRYIAERYVRLVLGRVPTASDWLRRITGRKWMAKQMVPPALPPWAEFS